jgi:hypothetical protein
MLKIVTGDLLRATEKYLCHQCNCITTRSKHLAKTVFTALPYANIYSERKEPSKPGTIIIKGDGKSERQVVNMLGQYYPGSKYPNSNKDGCKARFNNFKSCLEKMKKLEGDFAFPWRIGCGAAGGDWDLYLGAIREFEQGIAGNVTIYKLGATKPLKSKQQKLF